MQLLGNQHNYKHFPGQLKSLKIWGYITFVVFGIASTIWFLIRVIPKPSRATYPCVQAAAPIASAFVIYLLSLSGSVLAYRKFKSFFKQAKYFMALGALVIALFLAFTSIPTSNSNVSAMAEATPLEDPNTPMGDAKGIFPGRVVWVHNPDATNKNCTNSYGDAYFMDQHTNQSEVDKMLTSAVLNLTGAASSSEAWDEIFMYYNEEKGKGAIGYQSGEKIFLKINNTSTWGNNINHDNYSRVNNQFYAVSETSPHVVMSLLRQLVYEAGVPQNMIYLGDPMKFIYQDNFDKWHAEFPDVHYLHYSPDDQGREGVVASTTAIIDYSDRGTILPVNTDYLYTIFEEMEYMINIPNMKAHVRAGVTMFPKNHFGSHTRSDASHLHNGLIEQQNPENNRTSYGLYRVQVDIMGHELLGKKNLVYLMDALYCSDYEVDTPEKWHIAPFNGDWTSSLFLSQDPVAIESVGFDFLYANYDGSNGLPAYPHYGAVDDYLHQAADVTTWPIDITYDPENDGTPLVSLGVHEHWNNSLDKQYSRNLGTGNGIELLHITEIPVQITAENSGLVSNQVNVVFVDSTNIKWFGTDSGLSRFSGSIWDTIDINNHLLNNAVSDIAFERTGYGPELWIATKGGLTVMSIDAIDGVTGSTTYHTGNSRIICDTITAVGVDLRHNRWIGTTEGISLFRESVWDSLKDYLDGNGNVYSLSGISITDIEAYNPNEQVLLATDGGGVLRYDYNDVDGFTGASTYDTYWSGFQSNSISDISVRNTIQGYASDNGAYEHEGDNTKTFWTHYKADSGLVSINVLSILIDSEENIWFGTDNGLTIKASDGWYEYQESDGLINSTVNSICEDMLGNIWIGTDGGVEWFSGIPGNKIVFPGAPVLVSPADLSVNLVLPVTLSWTTGLYAESNHLQVAGDISFTNLIVDEDDLTGSTYVLDNLLNAKTYYWRILSNKEGYTSEWSEVWSFTTAYGELPVPSLYLPDSGAIDQSIDLTLSWHDVIGANRYRIQVGENFDLSSPDYDNQNISTNQYSIPGLNNSTTYFWRIKAYGEGSESTWSETWSFTTRSAGLPTPLLSLPGNEAVDQEMEVLLSWQSVVGAISYKIQLDENSDFNSPVCDTQNTGNTELSIAELDYNTRYYWRVMAFSAETNSEWSAIWSFTTKNIVLNRPLLSLPSHGSTDQLLNLTLFWQTVENADSYYLQLDDEIDFGSPLIVYEAGNTNSFNVPGLENNSTYFWKVMAGFEEIRSPWSEIWSFSTVSSADFFRNENDNSKLHVYPNPASSFLTIQVGNNSSGEIRVELLRMNGSKVFEQEYFLGGMNDSFTIHLSSDEFAKGIYILKIIMNSTIITKQITFQ